MFQSQNKIGNWYQYFIFLQLGLASINTVASSPLLGFGTLSKDTPNSFSVLDFHGINDELVPYDENSDYCLGIGENGGLLAPWGVYFESKIPLLNQWASVMDCEEEELFPTP